MTEEIIHIDRHWKLTNYLSVLQMYVNKKGNVQNPLTQEDLKQHAFGHWGTTPGINFIYAHLNYYIKKYERDVQLVVGPGHAALPIMSNAFLEETIDFYYENQLHIDEGIERWLSIPMLHGFRSELNPFYPGTIYDGGELGYSLAVAYGSTFDNPSLLTVCIIGDGEAETGTLAASWQCSRLRCKEAGIVLPILHLNGFKMGGPSLFSRMNDDELKMYFSGMGYIPKIVKSNHGDMIDAFDWIEQQYQGMSIDSKLPMLILHSPKGWTAPDWKCISIEGQSCSHKDPLGKMKISDERAEYIQKWLDCYLPAFSASINMDKWQEEVQAWLPKKSKRISNSLKRYTHQCLNLPDSSQFSWEGIPEYRYGQLVGVVQYLSEVIRQNPKKFRIMSPDELESNLMGELLEVDYEIGGHRRVMEILNENICQAWAQGYIQTGYNALIVSYEAFIPVISSMVSQYSKWLFQTKKIHWRTPRSSLNYLLTSVCWSNTYSHQNPEFINSLLANKCPDVRVYLPADANCVIVAMELCLSSVDRINTIVCSKQAMPQWFDFQTAKIIMKKGICSLNCNKEESPHIIFVASGDYQVRETKMAINLLKELVPSIRIRLIIVTELTILGSQKVYPYALSEQEFTNYFSDKIPVVYSFHGYVSALQILLFERHTSQDWILLGYQNKSYMSIDDVGKLIMNENSRYDIAANGTQLLCKSGYLSDIQASSIQSTMNLMIQDYLLGKGYG